MIALMLGILGFLSLGIIALGTRYRWKTNRHYPPVTVVVCARDEEESIFDCIISLVTQNYPVNRIKYIFVNHLSTDKTGDIMDEIAAEEDLDIHVIHLTNEHPVLKGKIHALNEAMKEVKTEYVLLTDADCIVPENWVRSMVSYFSDNIVAVGGLISTEERGVHSGSLSRLQNVDHRYFMGIQAGLAGLKAFVGSPGTSSSPVAPHWFRPAFCIGNNLAFRYSAYKRIGGFEAIGPTLVEDHALMHKLLQQTGELLAINLDPDTRVYTKALTTYKTLWRQKRRWASAVQVFNPLNYFLFLIVFSVRIVLPWFIFFTPAEAFISLLMTALASSAVIVLVSLQSGDRIKLRELILHELYQVILNHALMVAWLVRWPIIWKGQKYK
ncbi:glycosyltransferase [bacterium]|nr:glycosyltransferase [bacterium]